VFHYFIDLDTQPQGSGRAAGAVRSTFYSVIVGSNHVNALNQLKIMRRTNTDTQLVGRPLILKACRVAVQVA
jgi:hypothetical protein